MAEEVIESYYNIITIVIDHAEMVMCAVCLCLLCRDFFKERKQLWTIGAAYFAMLAIQYYIPIYMGGIMAHAAASGVCLFFIFVWERKQALLTGFSRFPIKAYLVLVFFSIRDLSVNTALELFLLYSEKAWTLMYLWIDADSPAAWRIYLCEYVVSNLIMLMIEMAFILIAVHFINKVFYDRSGRYEWKEIAILLIPSAAGFTVHLLKKAYDDFYYRETAKDVMDFMGSYPSIAALLIVCYLTMLAAVIVELYLFQSLRKRQEEEKSRISMQNQIDDMQSHIAEVERIYTGIRGVRHDLNNHVHVIGQLLEQEQYEEASHYLKTMKESAEQFDFPIKTGSPVTDVIINEKYGEAKRKGIDFWSEFSFLPDINIDAFDISIVLNNLLENAFEAVCKSELSDKRVSIRSVRKKNAYLITVYNSYDKVLSLDDSGLPKTDKKESWAHGLGLKNVRMVAEKYFGTLAMEQEGENVTVTVMLMIK